jgi:hypothetical protein
VSCTLAQFFEGIAQSKPKPRTKIERRDYCDCERHVCSLPKLRGSQFCIYCVDRACNDVKRIEPSEVPF